MSKFIAIYVRVSSTDQKHRSQEPDLERWAQSQELPVKWYRDKFTGTTMDRPGWNKLYADIQAGKVAKLVCWKLDRLGRTARELLGLFDQLRQRKVDLLCVAGGISGLETPEGRLMAGLVAMFAEYDYEVRRERQTAGIAAAKAQGKRWGGSQKGRRLSVTKEQVATVHRMKAERAKVAAIARATGLTRPTVYRLLGEARPA